MLDAKQFEALEETCLTPYFLFDESMVAQRICDIRSILPAGVRICYAMKANPFILKSAASASDYVEVCSPGELAICRALDIPDELLVISGVYKEPAVMQKLIGSGAKIHRFTIESVNQFELLESIAQAEGVTVPVLIRLTSGNQFGIDACDLKRMVAEMRESQHLECCGVQYFSGTQKSSRKKISREIDTLDALMAELSEERASGVFELEYGPGLPVDYCEEDACSAELADRDLLSFLGESLANMQFKGALTLEIGRGIAACCGTYVTRVVDTKRNRGCNYAIVDGGKHQMVYYGQALALKPPACTVFPKRATGKPESWAICGALCTTGDMLVKKIDIDDLRVGDCVAFPNAGAYCMTEGLALFLSRDLPRMYLRDKSGVPKLVRDRVETCTLNTPMV